MPLSEFLLQNLKGTSNYFIHKLLSNLDSNSYTLENGKVIEMHVFNNGQPVIAWYEVAAYTVFWDTRETLLTLGCTTWWGTTQPLEEIDHYFLLKLEKGLIERNIAELTYRQMQIEAILTGREEEYREVMENIYIKNFDSWEENMAFSEPG